MGRYWRKSARRRQKGGRQEGGEIEPGEKNHLYFETDNLRRFCKSLERAGAKLTQQPKKMPSGWTHAYLDDPNGHEVSVYSAGLKRLKRTARA